MQRLISRFMLIQKKFMSRYTKGHQYGMVLYNEKPQISTSLVVRFDDNNMGLYQPTELKNIRKSSSKPFRSSNSTYIVLYPHSGHINIPVIDERINSEEAPIITFVDIMKWFAKTEDTGNKDPVQPSAKIGRLDAANEAGFFHRTDRSRLKEIKKKLKDKVDSDPTEPKKSG